MKKLADKYRAGTSAHEFAESADSWERCSLTLIKLEDKLLSKVATVILTQSALLADQLSAMNLSLARIINLLEARRDLDTEERKPVVDYPSREVAGASGGDS